MQECKVGSGTSGYRKGTRRCLGLAASAAFLAVMGVLSQAARGECVQYSDYMHLRGSLSLPRTRGDSG
jgi:hypothetical protein